MTLRPVAGPIQNVSGRVSLRACVTAMSLIEVMIAVMVLAIAMSSTVGLYIHLDQNRDMTTRINRAQALARHLLDRTMTADPESLGDLALSPWSAARYEPMVAGVDLLTDDQLPMTDTSTVANNNVVSLGLVDQQTGLENLEVYFEYYRGVTVNNVAPALPDVGLMDQTFATAASFRAAFATAAVRSATRLLPTARPATQVGEEMPFVVRIVVRWGVAQTQRIELFAARRRPTGS